MRKSVLLVNSLAGSAVLTLLTAGAILLCLMFSTGEGEYGRKEALFGSLFFESRDKGGNITGATLGIANPTGLFIVFALVFVVLIASRLALHRLRNYRSALSAERNSNG
ncbi:hypothetical protein [Nocardia sp. NBC_00403]|uniref:hypothetical protein n=1 Tax=Nocardia sp. NBC_00403 TaxID=2975990 RepID=UPI002E1DC200